MMIITKARLAAFGLLLAALMSPASSAAPPSIRRALTEESGSADSNGDSATGSGDSDDDKGPKKRECEISRSAREVEIECKSEMEDEANDIDIEDEIEYKVRATSQGVSIKVEYKSEVEMDDVETETETQYDVVFDRIVEFIGSNADGSYNFENGDVAISEVALTEWNDFSDIVTSTDGIVSHFFLKSMDGMVEFKFTISRAGEGESISANKMKIDFRLTGYPWVETTSNVALMSSIESKKKVEVERDDEDGDQELDDEEKGKARDVMISFNEAVEGTGVIPFGEYTWATTAEATSNSNETASNETVAVSNVGAATRNTISVVATSPKAQTDENMETIAFSFVGSGARFADEIYWDPEAGIGYTSSAPRMLSTMVSSAILSSLVAMIM